MNELEQIQQALDGDKDAAERIINTEVINKLQATLVKRGASNAEAKDITADLIGDCFKSTPAKPALLTKYNGKGSLGGFLTRAALNRLIDLKRRDKFRGAVPVAPSESGPVDDFDRLAAEPEAEQNDEILLNILKDSLKYAYEQCDPEALLLMRLISVYDVNQETIATMMGWSQSKVSRTLSQVMDTIRAVTVSEIKKADDWLDIKFEDFVDLCRSSSEFYVGGKN